MPGQLTEVSIAALNLSLAYEQMCWPVAPERFLELRQDARTFLETMGVEGVELPTKRDAYLEQRPMITPAVLDTLATHRSKLLGDTYALPIFFLGSMSYRAAMNIALRLGYQQEEEIIRDCLEDLGVDQKVTEQLERDAGWIAVRDEGTDERSIAQADVIKAGASFVIRVIEETPIGVGELAGLKSLVLDVRAEVKDLREEFRNASERLEDLILAGNEEVRSALDQIKRKLLEAGIPKESADQLTDADPKDFWTRVVRWFGGAKPLNALEAALWAALDFVPGGTAVKLGVKVANAVRTALK